MLKPISRLILCIFFVLSNFWTLNFPLFHKLWSCKVNFCSFVTPEIYFCLNWQVGDSFWFLGFQLRKFKILPACLKWQNSPRGQWSISRSKIPSTVSSTNGSHDQKWHQSLVETLQQPNCRCLGFLIVLVHLNCLFIMALLVFCHGRPFLYLEDISGMCRLLPIDGISSCCKGF